MSRSVVVRLEGRLAAAKRLGQLHSEQTKLLMAFPELERFIPQRFSRRPAWLPIRRSRHDVAKRRRF